MNDDADTFDLISDLIENPDHGWSIGSFGAIGEFIRDPHEQVHLLRRAERLEISTARGAMRVERNTALRPIAWDSLSSDGESWRDALAFCVPHQPGGPRVIQDLGEDTDAIRTKDRSDRLFDLGVGSGAVRMCVRSGDEGLIGVMIANDGRPVLGDSGIMGEVLRAQPHRVVLSPAGRIEIFQSIPPPDGQSPEGPHSHLLPKLVVKDQPHSANVPLPYGWQSALTVHPASPWRTIRGERRPFDPTVNQVFLPLLRRYSLEEDAVTALELHRAIDAGESPEFAAWPDSRRGRTKARIELRRRAAAGDPRVAPWRALYDRAGTDSDASAGERA